MVLATVITILNYYCKKFIEQATDENSMPCVFFCTGGGGIHKTSTVILLKIFWYWCPDQKKSNFMNYDGFCVLIMTAICFANSDHPCFVKAWLFVKLLTMFDEYLSWLSFYNVGKTYQALVIVHLKRVCLVIHSLIVPSFTF